MPRFIVSAENIQSGTAVLSDEESRHAIRVLRLSVGSVVELLDGSGTVYRGVVASVSNGIIRVAIGTTIQNASPSLVQITLCPAVIKSDRMEWMIEKACELGVYAIRPFIASRSVVRVDSERWASKAQRWKKIAEASCKQCGLPRLPDITEPVSLKQLTQTFRDYDLVLIPALSRDRIGLWEVLSSHPGIQSALVLIGPEGDFTDDELSLARSAGAVPVTLGSLILRAETAALCVLSVIQQAPRQAKE